MELAESAIAVDNTYTSILTQHAQQLTGLENPNSPVQIRQWIEKTTGCVVMSLSKETMPDLMKEFVDYPDVIELLNIRKSSQKRLLRSIMLCLIVP